MDQSHSLLALDSVYFGSFSVTFWCFFKKLFPIQITILHFKTEQ